jgi:hypothetical protein
MQNFDYFIGVTVHDNVRLANKLSGSFHLSRTAQAWKVCQFLNVVDNCLSDILRGGRIASLDVFNGSYKLVSRFRRPANPPHE